MKNIILFIISLTFLVSCGPTYPKNQIEKAVENLVNKEYGLIGEARLKGRVLYLDVMLKDLTATKTNQVTEAIKKLQGAVLTITRVALSSDAEIRYMVVSSYDPAWKLGIRIIQNMEDIKGFLYQKISKGDYEGRLVLEVENGDTNKISPIIALNSEVLAIKEFVGRLVASQINMLSRSNPFLGVVLDNFKLRYFGFTGDSIILQAVDLRDKDINVLFKEVIKDEFQKVIKKYDIKPITKLTIVGKKNNTLFETTNTATTK